MKRILLIFAVLTAFTFSAKAHDFSKSSDGKTIYYNITDATALTVEVTFSGSSYNSYTEYSGDVNIPSTVYNNNGRTYHVTSIGYYAFRECSGLTSVTIPESVISIGNSSFEGCSSLTSITIPDNVTKIGDCAFHSCTSLTTLNFNAENCADFDCFEDLYSVFYACPLSNVTIGEGVKNIPAYFLYNQTGVGQISIPESVTSIGSYAFRYCTSLSTLNFNAENCADFSIYLMFGIEPAFYSCSLTTVTIGGKVKHLPAYFLYKQTGVGQISIPESVTSIGSHAFYFCSGLNSITIGESVTSIGSYAFHGCSGLSSITIPESVTSIGDEAFSYCKSLSSITIGDGVTSIGSYAFYHCEGLSSITIGEGVTSIGKSAFCFCEGLSSITIPDGVTSIGNSAFYNCEGLSSITIGEGVTSIGDQAFYGCSGLSSITIPERVTEIGYSAFGGCSGLSSITIPESVTSIGNRAFYCCSGLSTLNFNAESCEGFSSGTYSVFYACPLSNVTIGENVKNIPGYFLYNQTGISSITIPESVTSIGAMVFDGCSGLNTLNFNAENCTNFNYTFDTYHAFCGCSLTTVNIGENVKKIPACFLCNQTGVGSISLPDDVTSIGSSAFRGCSGLSSITIPEGVTSIGSYAFSGTSWLNNQADGVIYIGSHLYSYKGDMPENTTIEVKDGTTSIVGYAFYDCTSLSSITIPERVTEIGYSAFRGCTSLSSITIPESVTLISDYAFSGCTGLTEMTVEAVTPPTIYNFTFNNVDRSIPVYVPSASVADYQAHEYWGEFDIQGVGSVDTDTDTGDDQVIDGVSIADFIAAADTEKTRMLNDVTVVYSNGWYTWVQDATGSLHVYGTFSDEVVNGDIITGLNGTYALYKTYINEMTNSTYTSVKSGTSVISPEVVTASSLSTDDVNKYVAISGTVTGNATLSTSSSTFFTIKDDAGNKVELYTKLKNIDMELSEGDFITVEGMVSYNSVIQVYPISIKVGAGESETATETVKADEIDFIQNGNTISFTTEQQVSVYSINGICVFSGITRDIQLTTRGVYVVVTTSGATKIII